MKDRWELRKNEIVWKVKDGAHVDNMEMAGRKMAVVVYYGVDEEGRRIPLPVLIFEIGE